jgi:hypothetical protein
MTEEENEFVRSVYWKYAAICGGFPCGRCKDIASEIRENIGGQVVAGLIGDGIQHYWVEKDNEIIDPMYQEETRQPVYYKKV